jgi:hypothetical protein
MTNYTHQTAPTQFVEASGIRFAYSRFGAKREIPLLFFMHLSGTMRSSFCTPTAIMVRNINIQSSLLSMSRSPQRAAHLHKEGNQNASEAGEASRSRSSEFHPVQSRSRRRIRHGTSGCRYPQHPDPPRNARLFYETERSLIASKKLSTLGALL